MAKERVQRLYPSRAFRLLSAETAEAPGTPTAEAKRPSLMTPHGQPPAPLPATASTSAPVEAAAGGVPPPAEEPQQQSLPGASSSATSSSASFSEQQSGQESGRLLNAWQHPQAHAPVLDGAGLASGPSAGPEEAESVAAGDIGAASVPAKGGAAASAPDHGLEMEREAHLAQVPSTCA